MHKIFFLHVPKTAGLTMHGILKTEYNKSKQYVIRQVALTQQYLNLSKKRKESIGVVKGHFLFGLHEQENNTTCLTFLREPIARTVSGYNFICNYTQHPLHKHVMQHKLTLYDFLDQKIAPNFDNIQVRFLCGNNSMPFGEVTQKHADIAIQNLTKPNVLFGITEHFNASILCFKQALNWGWPCYQKTNVTHKTNITVADLNERTLNKIRETNAFDLQLYAFAKKEFETHIKNLGSGFEQEVKKFEALNASYVPPKPRWLEKWQNRKFKLPD